MLSGLTFNPFLCNKMVQFDPFACSSPVTPTALVEMAVFSLSYTLASYGIDELTMCPRLYFLLVCVSVFMPVPYLFDDHSFLVSSEIKEPDS